MRKPSFFKSVQNAKSGAVWMFRNERNFQLEFVALVVNIFLIYELKLSLLDSAIILLVSFVVLAAETFNTAIEKICDIVQPRYDERVRFIKDISAGAVILLAFCSVIIGLLVYWKYLFV